MPEKGIRNNEKEEEVSREAHLLKQMKNQTSTKLNDEGHFISVTNKGEMSIIKNINFETGNL
jgi:hypothetical protein